MSPGDKTGQKYYKEFNCYNLVIISLKSTNLNFILFVGEVFYSNGPYKLIFIAAPVRPCVLISLDILGTSIKFWSHQAPYHCQVGVTVMSGEDFCEFVDSFVYYDPILLSLFIA